MLHFGVDVLPDGGIQIGDTICETGAEARRLILGQLEGAGRQHVAWWTVTERAAEALCLQLFARDGLPFAPGGVWPELRLGDGGVRSARWHDRWHLRTVQAWTGTVTIGELADDDCEADSGAMVIQRWVTERLGGAMRQLAGSPRASIPSTPGAAAVQLWSRRYHTRREWTWHDWADTATLDWLRLGYHPPRCDWADGGALAHSQIVTAGAEAPDRGLRRVDLPSGWRIFYLDLRSAFPALMTRPMPDVRGVVLHRPDLDGDGIVEATVTLRGGVRCLPVRYRIDGRPAVAWPSKGTFRDTWHTLHLWKAAQAGAEIEIHRHMIWRDSYTPFTRFVGAVQGYLGQTARGPLRLAIKAIGRAMYGKLGQHRRRRSLVPRATLAAALDAQDAGAEPMIGRDRLVTIYGWWGELAAVVVETPDYAPQVNPVWAAGITATSAIKLGNAEARIQAAGGRPIYMDTDGIWLAAPTPILELGPGLGQWRMEHEAAWAAFYDLKRYEASGVDGGAGITCWAGVPKADQVRAFSAGRIELTRAATVAESMVRGIAPGDTVAAAVQARRR